MPFNERCGICNEKLNKKMSSNPKCLSVVPKAGSKDCSQVLYLENEDSFTMNYGLVAFAGYFGNGSSGHYLAYRKDEKSWLEISDSHVQRLE